MPQVAGQMPAMVVAPPPGHPAPHDFLMLAMVTTIICGILNLLSLAFGIPAIVLAALVYKLVIRWSWHCYNSSSLCIQSMSAKNSKNYPQAKRHGRNALILTILNIIFTMFLCLLIIGLITGFHCVDYNSYYYNYYYYPRKLWYWHNMKVWIYQITVITKIITQVAAAAID